MGKDYERKVHELKDKIKEFCEARDWDKFHNAKELAIALSIEASELLEIFRWKSSEEVKSLFLSIASKLGHKKFAQKENVWKENYTVTLNHYIEPRLVERVKGLVR